MSGRTLARQRAVWKTARPFQDEKADASGTTPFSSVSRAEMLSACHHVLGAPGSRTDSPSRTGRGGTNVAA